VVELGDGWALVVDPARDPTPYLRLARERRLQLAYVAETHLHADFLTGSRELEAAGGAQILAPRTSRLGFAHQGLEGGQEVDLGGLTLRVLATPGHAPEQVSDLLQDAGRPLALFSGGALLVGTVARTDLAGPELTGPLARAAYRSVHQRLLSLPDDPAVYPTHGAGSFCAAPGEDERTTTIGAECRHNRLLAAPDKDSFVAQLVAGFGSCPPYCLRLRERNRTGPELLGADWRARPRLGAGQVRGHLAGGMTAWQAAGLPEARLPLVEATQLGDRPGVVLDVRQAGGVADGHLPGAVAVELGALTGARLPDQLPAGPVAVMCGHGERAMTAASLLERAGHKDLRVVHGGPRDWQRATGQALARS
jgi:hydroxyacylglutathione hydrolase